MGGIRQVLVLDRSFFIKLAGLTLLSVGIMCFFQASQASAYITLSPSPAPMPGDGDPAGIRAYLERCDNPNQPAPPPAGGIQNPAFSGWVSDDGNQASTIVNVAYGEAFTTLMWHTNGAVCSGSQLGVTYSNFIVESSSVTGPGWLAFIDGKVVGFGWPPRDPSSTGFYNQYDEPFLYMAPAGGFTTDHWITITLNTKGINRFGASTDICISNGVGVPNIDSWGPCAVQPLVANIFIDVADPPNGPPSGSFDISCDAAGNIAIDVTVNDPENDLMTINATISGASPGSHVGQGRNGTWRYYNGWAEPDGRTVTVSGTITDGSNNANMAADSVVCARPAAVFTCSLATVPPGMIEAGQPFEIQVTVANTSSSYALPMTPASHPIDITMNPIAGVTGRTVPPNYSAAYTAGFGPGTAVVATDSDVVATQPAIYTLGATVGSVTCPGISITVGRKPYVKLYGGEAWVGGAFASGGSCPSPMTAPPVNQANAYGFARSTASGYAGSSTQFSLSAYHDIDGFFSASTRAPALGNSTPPKGLTLSNTNAATYGGNNIDGLRCITDFFNDTRDSTIMQPGNWPGSLPAMQGRRQYTRSGNYTINGLTVPQGTQAAVYIDGDLYISGNIQYQSTLIFDRLPYFVVIVRGNIYIDNDVTRLDGMYIAQPSSATNGIIYTCARSMGVPYGALDPVGDDMYARCGNQLSINGSIAARQVKFHRVRGTLTPSAGVPGSQPQEVPAFTDGSGTNAAEVINYTPEMWLVPSPLRRPGDPEGSYTPEALHHTYDSIKILPPIL